MDADSPILTVAGLSVAFDDVVALQDVSFVLKRGENLAVIGPNGAGKTVLMRALLGIVSSEGAVSWAPGVRIGYVPQKIDADRHLPINALNLLTARAGILKCPDEEVRTVIGEVGLTERLLTTPIGHLSGGEFQRALIAFALLGKPDVLLLDEPTASIDRPSEEHIYALVARLRAHHDMAVILAVHELAVVQKYATHVLCLNKNAICFGAPAEALTEDTLRHLYGSPMPGFEHHHHHHHQHHHAQ